jgi:hypothetical protein
MKTAHNVGDVVVANTDAQGLTKGERYTVQAIEQGAFGIVQYQVQLFGVRGAAYTPKLWIGNGHIVLSKAPAQQDAKPAQITCARCHQPITGDNFYDEEGEHGFVCAPCMDAARAKTSAKATLAVLLDQDADAVAAQDGAADWTTSYLRLRCRQQLTNSGTGPSNANVGRLADLVRTKLQARTDRWYTVAYTSAQLPGTIDAGYKVQAGCPRDAMRKALENHMLPSHAKSLFVTPVGPVAAVPTDPVRRADGTVVNVTIPE